MKERARQSIRKLGTRAEALGNCQVCGEQVKPRHDPVKAWADKYAHGKCAGYVRRRGRRNSQRVYRRFTAA